MQHAKIEPMIGTMLTVAINEPVNEVVVEIMVSCVVLEKGRRREPNVPIFFISVSIHMRMVKPHPEEAENMMECVSVAHEESVEEVYLPALFSSRPFKAQTPTGYSNRHPVGATSLSSFFSYDESSSAQ